MKVTLNVTDDAGLRAAVKDMIKGQVLSIVREELLEIFRDELGRKVKGMDTYAFNRMMKEAMMDAGHKIYEKEMAGKSMRSDILTPIVEVKVNQAIAAKDWDKLVDDMANLKIQKLLKR